jgi:hypothetical protein
MREAFFVKDDWVLESWTETDLDGTEFDGTDLVDDALESYNLLRLRQ